MQVPAHQGKRSPETPHCQHLDPGFLASRTGRKQFPVVKVSCIPCGHLSTLMCSLDQESLERAHLKDSRGYAGDDSASSRLPNINNCHPPRFSRTQPVPVDSILQTTTSKHPHPTLFLPHLLPLSSCFFFSLLLFCFVLFCFLLLS